MLKTPFPLYPRLVSKQFIKATLIFFTFTILMLPSGRSANGNTFMKFNPLKFYILS